MATKLGLYNAALLHIGERTLATLTDAVESRRVLDVIYTDAVDYMLEQGFWRFAQRTVKIDYDANVTPSFGYLRAYTQPTDMVRLYKICPDEFLNLDLLEFTEEGGRWYGHEDQIYVTYISNDAAYGADLSLWPESFTLYAGLYLATRIADRLTPSADVGKQGNNNLMSKMRRALDDATAKDAMKGPIQFEPNGTWTNSRSRRAELGDRGNKGSLIG